MESLCTSSIRRRLLRSSRGLRNRDITPSTSRVRLRNARRSWMNGRPRLRKTGRMLPMQSKRLIPDKSFFFRSDVWFDQETAALVFPARLLSIRLTGSDGEVRRGGEMKGVEMSWRPKSLPSRGRRPQQHRVALGDQPAGPLHRRAGAGSRSHRGEPASAERRLRLALRRLARGARVDCGSPGFDCMPLR